MKFKSDIEIQAGVEAGGSTGSNGQVLSSTGSGVAWIDQGDITIGEAEVAKSLQVTVKNVSGGELIKGTVVHTAPTASPPSGNVIEVIAADYDDTTKMPAVGILKETIANEAEGEAVMTGTLSGIATDAFSIGDELYVGADGALTNIKPQTAGQLIQKIAVCVKSHASNGLIKIFGAGRSNDVPLPLYIDNTNQRLGIGTASPGDKLQVAGNAIIQDYAYIGDGVQHWGDGGTGMNFPANDTIDLATSSTSRIRINSSGNVGIGTTSPSTKLDVVGDFGIQGILFWNTGTGTTGGSGVANGFSIPYRTSVTALNTAYNYRVRLTTTGTGTNSGSCWLVGYNKETTTWFVRMVSQSGNTSNHPLLAISSGNNAMVAYTNHASSYPIRWSCETIGISDNDGTLHNMGADFQWQRNIDNLVYSDGNVGIGTTSPSYKLEVSGNAALSLGADRYLRIGSSTNYWWDLQSVSNDFTLKEAGSNTRLIVKAGGNVGIGTTSPSEKLEVSEGYILSSGASTSHGFELQRTGSDTYQLRHLDGGLTVFNSTDSRKEMTFNGSGNVGIGTTSPLSKLHVVSGEISNGANKGIRIENFNGTKDYSIRTGISGLENTSLAFYDETAGVNRMVIKSNGNVGIGTTSPVVKLQVDGTITSTGVLTAYTSVPSINIGHNGDSAFIAATSGGGANTPISFSVGNNNEKMRITSDGKVGIGTTSPSAKLDVEGRVDFSNDLRLRGTDSSANQGVTRFYVDSSNKLFIDTANDGSNLFVIDSSGNVGIGTTNPSAKLDVIGNASIGSTANNNGGSSYNLRLDALDTSSIGFHDSGSTIGAITFSAAQGGFILGANHASYGPHKVRTASDFIVDGNVGIGTTSPNEKLDVRGKLYIESQGVDWNESTPGTVRGALHFDPVGNGADNTGNAITFGASDTSVGTNAQAGIYTRSDGSYGTKMYFATTDLYITGSKTRMMIDYNGNVGIGTTSPQSKLQVDGGVQMADDTDTASAGKVGTLRYRTSGNNSYVDMCMQTGASTYEWVNIVQNNW